MQKQIIEYSPDQVAERLRNATRDYKRSMDGNYIGRRWRAFQWKYDNNPAYKDVIDLIWITVVLGILCGSILAVSIVQYLKPWLK